jgi:hypothetical protein
MIRDPAKANLLDAIAALWLSKSQTEIARQIGLSTGVVSGLAMRARRNGDPRFPSRPNPARSRRMRSEARNTFATPTKAKVRKFKPEPLPEPKDEPPVPFAASRRSVQVRRQRRSKRERIPVLRSVGDARKLLGGPCGPDAGCGLASPALPAWRTPSVNRNQIFASLVRAATWQLMRRSPTLLLLAVVAAAWLFAGHH